MATTIKTNPLFLIIDDSVPRIISEFLTNCKVKKWSKKTIRFHQDELDCLWRIVG